MHQRTPATAAVSAVLTAAACPVRAVLRWRTTARGVGTGQQALGVLARPWAAPRRLSGP